MRRPRSNTEWSFWGKWDPLYGVASLTGRNKRGNKPWSDDEFYAHGASNWDEYRPHWESYGVSRRSCVEIGCGAGRITKHLANYFGEVHAVDVSQSMIDYAKQHVRSQNVSFYVTDGLALPFPSRSATAAFSTEVFQHFSRPAMADIYFADLHRVLEPGASLMIHLPVYTWPSGFRRTFRALYRIQRLVESLQAEGRRFLLKIGVGYPFMFGVQYDSRRLYDSLVRLGFRDMELRFFQTSGEGDIPDFRSYLFARKSTARAQGPVG
jgi:SAM-dependent methyltransferase